MTAPLDPIPPPTGALALETFELTKRFGAFGQSISAGVRPPARSRFSATLMLGASVKCW